MRVKKKTKNINNVILGILAAIWISPMFFVVMNIFKSKQEYNLGSLWLWPKAIALKDNFKTMVANHVFNSLGITLVYAFTGAFFAIVFALLAAYALTQLRVRHRFFWFIMIYCGTIFPFQVYLIPIFKAYQQIGLYNTWIGMIIFYCAICIPYSLFVFRNFFLNIDKEICEAARLEGASEMTILTKIFMPMATAPISIVFLSQFTWIWNELMFGLTFTKSTSTRPIMASLSTLGTGNAPVMFLSCIISSIPTLALFFALNKNFQKGFAYTAK